MKKFIMILFVLIIIVIAVVALSGLFKSDASKNIIPNQAPKTGTIDDKTSTSTTVPPASKRPATDGKLDQASVPTVKSLMAKSWQWTSTTASNGKQTFPKDSSRFTLKFATDGVFSSTTDCNGVGGKYVVNQNNITFSEMMSTLMFCSEGSQETEYKNIFENAQTFKIIPDGSLRVDMKYGAGYAIFK